MRNSTSNMGLLAKLFQFPRRFSVTTVQISGIIRDTTDFIRIGEILPPKSKVWEAIICAMMRNTIAMLVFLIWKHHNRKFINIHNTFQMWMWYFLLLFFAIKYKNVSPVLSSLNKLPVSHRIPPFCLYFFTQKRN